jgi:hypothetical protein
MSENLADLAPRPSYEQIVQSIKRQGVQEILRHGWADEQRLGRELEVLVEDLNPEAKERKARELIDRYSPKISSAYQSAKAKVEASAESSYRFSQPFPEGRTFAQARARDAAELLAVQSEAEAIAQRVVGTSLQEATKAVSKHPGDKGIRQTASHTLDGLRAVFNQAMAHGGMEGRVAAMAVECVCTQMGIDLEAVVDHHRTDAHRRALEDAKHFERAAFVLPSGNRPMQNPFDSKRRGSKHVGTYSSGNKAVVAAAGRSSSRRPIAAGRGSRLDRE